MLCRGPARGTWPRTLGSFCQGKWGHSGAIPSVQLGPWGRGSSCPAHWCYWLSSSRASRREWAQDRNVQKTEFPKQNWLPVSLTFHLQGEPGIRASLPSPFWSKSTSRRPRDRTLQPVRCPLGPPYLRISPHSHPRSLVQSLCSLIACQLGAWARAQSQQEGPGLRAATAAGTARCDGAP